MFVKYYLIMIQCIVRRLHCKMFMGSILITISIVLCLTHFVAVLLGFGMISVISFVVIIRTVCPFGICFIVICMFSIFSLFHQSNM